MATDQWDEKAGDAIRPWMRSPDDFYECQASVHAALRAAYEKGVADGAGEAECGGDGFTGRALARAADSIIAGRERKQRARTP